MVSNQVLSKPFAVVDSTNQHLMPLCNCIYDKTNIEQILCDEDDNDLAEDLVQLTKRRTQPKANLAGLWGVPTKFA